MSDNVESTSHQRNETAVETTGEPPQEVTEADPDVLEESSVGSVTVNFQISASELENKTISNPDEVANKLVDVFEGALNRSVENMTMLYSGEEIQYQQVTVISYLYYLFVEGFSFLPLNIPSSHLTR